MTEQEYKHIRNLAWDLLIDSHSSKLPIDINAIAKLYDLTSLVDNSKSLYDNTLIVCGEILKIFGYSNVDELKKYLSIRVLSPMIIIKALNVPNKDELSKITELPISIANQRFNRYKMLLERNAFETSKLESKVLSNFDLWLNSQSY